MTTFDDVLTWSGTSLYDAGDALKAVANKYEDVYEELTGLSTDGLEGKTAEAEAKARRILADDATCGPPWATPATISSTPRPRSTAS